jgi:hypothetical protein
MATARTKPFEMRRKIESRTLRFSAQTIFTKVQQWLIEDDAHEPWICQVPVCTQNLLDAHNILGAL